MPSPKHFVASFDVNAPRPLMARFNLPFHFFLGLALVVFFWLASWTRFGVFGEYAFFPQWLGYIFTVDGWVARRKKSSLMMRAPREFILLFILSAPMWWVFEGLNNLVLNWHYIIPSHYSILQIIVESTIAFSIVIPAVFETTELILTFDFARRLPPARSFHLSPKLLWLLMFAGAFGFAALVLAPRIAFPLTWVWLILILDPLNCLRGRESLIGQAARGDYRLIVALAMGGLICGLFWEMWNYWAFPQWYYTVPFSIPSPKFLLPTDGRKHGKQIKISVFFSFCGVIIRLVSSNVKLAKVLLLRWITNF